MRIVFMGTPDFAVETLRRLVADGHEVCAVFTQPDKPTGRRMRLTPSPVKQAALALGAPVYQPPSLKDPAALQSLAALAPQVIVVVAYGQILPVAALAVPPFGCINLHASLLPRWRGAAPMQWSIIEGDAQAGVTTMFMAKGLDTGDMILKQAVEIGENETFGALHDRLATIGARLMSQTLPLLESGNAPREKQNDALACYAPRITRETCRIDFSKPAAAVHRLVRGLSPAPGAFSTLGGKAFKIYETRLSPAREGQSGEVFAGDGTLDVRCGDGRCVRLLTVQAQGGRRLGAEEYLRGHRPQPGERMGE